MRQGLVAGVLGFALALLGVTLWLLVRTLDAAEGINTKAHEIAHYGRGIDIATDSVIQLSRTNRLAASILRSARPLSGQLAAISNRAQSIDATAGSIDSTAGSINGTAGAIDTTAGGILGSARQIDATAGAIHGTAGTILGTAGRINGTAGAIDATAGRINGTATGINVAAGRILGISRAIDRDVRLINVYTEQSIAIVRAIKGDTGDIDSQARLARHYAACIDQKVGGAQADGDCEKTQGAGG